MQGRAITWSYHQVIQTLRRMLSTESRPLPLRSKKKKSFTNPPRVMVDYRRVQTEGGNGGNGCISLLQLWANDRAGPDGGDGGNGGHVVFEANVDTRDLGKVSSVIKAGHGEKGTTKSCSGKNAQHVLVKVPLGTIVKNSQGKVIADLEKAGTLFVAARGGSGGHGNQFFASDTNQTPQVAEYGAEGEKITYILEMRCLADVGLIGFPNAGKSTLLQAISRAKPKVAPYPFTTLKPYVGMVQYDDFSQLAVADLPGLVVDSHKNRGLGIGFLRHAERCSTLVMVLDLSVSEPWVQLEALRHELKQFSAELAERPQLIVANKIDIPESKENLKELLSILKGYEVLPISGKTGQNLTLLLKRLQELHGLFVEKHQKEREENDIEDEGQ